MTAANLSELVDSLARDGRLQDVTAAHRRIVLGYPAWLVLSELPPERLREELSRASGIRLLAASIAEVGVDRQACLDYGPERLQELRWLPLRDGSLAVADPFARLPDGPFEGRERCLAPHDELDATLAGAFPEAAATARQRRRLGRYLLDSGAVSEDELATALQEQQTNGGRLGEVLLAHGIVEPAVLTAALAARIGLAPIAEGSRPAPLLPRLLAHELRAVAIEPANAIGAMAGSPEAGPLRVAITDPTEAKLARISAELGRPVEAHLADEETLDALLASVYAQEDIVEVVGSLREQLPQFSALRTGLSRSQGLIVLMLGLLVAAGVAWDRHGTAVAVIALSTTFYILYATYRIYSAWRGWTHGSTIDPSPEDLAAMDGRDLPGYTVFIPVFREKPETLRTLFEALSRLDYPRQKLNGLLLVESDDLQTQQALVEMREVLAGGRPVRPGWLKTLLIPPGGPRTKPKAMIYGMLYASGDLLTIFDAEDKPDPDQLRKAAWAFRQTDDKTACIQAKLSYYNSRQNLLTRWFTLEYAAWFEMFLPGLHAMKAPIPLGGTSNHFRLDVLRQVLSWDPYNVTEDADLGLRLCRAGYRTLMLESTTLEEANSRFKNWLLQRSRWIKGYMQTFLVHTRDPVRLFRELGFVNSVHFLATVGGLIFTVVVSPLFWLMLVVWLLAQPGWIPSLFPGPVYYLAMASLIFGNFFFVFLALLGAVDRGQDDLSTYTLIFPVYWVMMSIAAYIALYELVRKPHYWQKTEHGLHLSGETAEAAAVRDQSPAPS